MVEKVNGRAAGGDFLGKDLEYFTLTTAVDIRPGAVGSASQNALDKVVEVISLRGQPVLMGAVTGSGPYVMRFALEHTAAWGPNTLVAGAAVTSLVETLVAAQAAGMGFTSGNTSVTVAQGL